MAKATPVLCTHFLLGVAEDDCLCDGENIVQIAQCVEFPVLHEHEEPTRRKHKTG